MEILCAGACIGLFIRRKYLHSIPVWNFGFGSNMSVENVERKKGHKVLASCSGIVHGWKMSFNLRGMALVEPAFANAMPGQPTDNIHGVAILLGRDDVLKLSAQERGYDKVWVEVNCYDGKKIKAFIFTRTRAGDRPFLPPNEQTPSVRYLNLLLKGAESGGLEKAYVKRLEETKTYTPSYDVIQRRRNLPSPKLLPKMTVAELAETRNKSDSFAHVAIFGYILKLARKKVWFKSHLGRDATARFSRHFNGVSMDLNDDMGKPPFLDLNCMSNDEREYIMMWLDFYLAKEPEIVGYVKEFFDECNFEQFLIPICDLASTKL